ncbi:ABC transporter permease [Azospirillum thermophilum]|uniref:Peptide ABC transporter permease n=1 Tax=Azospirillum thermophilum TaxID=2202148 RepID=A0A2S2D0R4_9PROT|nr:ABC transporter permease [Azospirillum thermophilum]AWK90057.1 peptide ABC transporter permease [Azospirillum thermophilum]
MASLPAGHGTAPALPAAGPARRSRSPFALLLRRLFRRRLVLVAMVVLGAILAVAAAAPWAAPYDPMKMDILGRLKPPSAAHWFGTDEFGRDVLSRVMQGAQISLLVGILVVIVATALGTLLGLAAGYVRALDGVLMRLTDALMAFPDILLAIAFMAALGPSLYNVVLALGIVYTPRVARVVRAAALVLREMPYVEAATALGATTPRIVFLHILPNLLSPVVVQATFIFAYAILTEAALSFLGVGVPPTTPTWGNMIAGAQQYFQQADWLVMFPGIAIVLTVLSLQVVGDGLRDALDPRLQKVT